MDKYKFENGSGIFIQIGAGAGDLDITVNNRDGFTEFVKKLPMDRVKKVILVEPNPLNIPLLKECWKNYPQSQIYELGIVPKKYGNQDLDFYYNPKDGSNFQVGSIIKDHVIKHYPNNCEINIFTIKTKHLENFVNEITTEEIELLSLDIEGIEAEVILDLNFNNINLKYLSFEHLHLQEKKTNVLNHLENNNFIFLGNGIDYNGFDYLYVNKFKY